MRNTTYFSGDSHLTHGNIIKYCKRLQFVTEEEAKRILQVETIHDSVAKRAAQREFRISDESVKKMDDSLIYNINDRVKQDDTLIHVGDFCTGNAQAWAYYRNKIRCKNIILCLGNHDKGCNEETQKLFTRVYPRGLCVDIRIGNHSFMLNHYAARTWQDAGKGVIHLYGHSHGTLSDDPFSLSMDVGVDCYDIHQKRYMPFSIDEIIKIMERKRKNMESARP